MTKILAIDGPAGAGKSTIARAVAARLAWRFVNTGAIYRAVALHALERALDDESEIAASLEDVELDFDGDRVILDGRDVSEAIRHERISAHASHVSAMPDVRAGLLELQRRVARADPVGAVLEGRDIGTVVFPDADVKVFLTASSDERARRRTKELDERGANPRYEDVLADIEARDERDMRRSVAPLKAADDAIYVDTTDDDVEAIVARIVGLVTTAS